MKLSSSAVTVSQKLQSVYTRQGRSSASFILLRWLHRAGHWLTAVPNMAVCLRFSFTLTAVNTITKALTANYHVNCYTVNPLQSQKKLMLSYSNHRSKCKQSAILEPMACYVACPVDVCGMHSSWYSTGLGVYQLNGSPSSSAAPAAMRSLYLAWASARNDGFNFSRFNWPSLYRTQTCPWTNCNCDSFVLHRLLGDQGRITKQPAVCLTHTHLTALFLGLPRWAGNRQVKPIWILLKQETVSGSGISWDICKSAPRSRQITTPAPHHSVFYRLDALPATQPTASKHLRQIISLFHCVGKQTETSCVASIIGWCCSRPQEFHQSPKMFSVG